MTKVLTRGAPALSEIAQPVPFGEEIGAIIEDMFQTMRQFGGIGLAANQVDVLKRVIVVNAAGFKQAFINPVIVRRQNGEQTAKEGCLSFPGLQVIKIRAMQIVVEGFDQNWRPVRFKLRGLAARVVQHEIDHLDGITIGDRAPEAA
jgi:peptide deformylase